MPYEGSWKDSSGVKVALNLTNPESPELRLSALPLRMQLMRNPISSGTGVYWLVGALKNDRFGLFSVAIRHPA